MDFTLFVKNVFYFFSGLSLFPTLFNNLLTNYWVPIFLVIIIILIIDKMEQIVKIFVHQSYFIDNDLVVDYNVEQEVSFG